MEPVDIKRKWDTLKSDRHNIEDLWDLIEQFVLPFRGEFFRDNSSESEVDWRKRKIYDSTAVVAAQNLAAAIQSNMINPSTRWFDMTFQNEELNSDDSAREWIEECATIIYNALNESNFNQEAAESILDMVGFGTTVIVEEVEEGKNNPTLDFSSMPIKEVEFEEGADGNLLSVYRELQWTALQCEEKFGKEKLPQKIADKLNTSEEGKIRFKIIFCIHRRRGIELDPEIKVAAPLLRPFASRYIFYDDPVDMKPEGGYYEMPAFIPRFRKTSGSKWGHGPAAVAMADILSLNELVETVLENAAKAVDPPTLVTKRGLLSTLDLGRGGLTVVKSLDQIKDYVTGARFDVAALTVENLQKSIRACFFVDQLELKDSPAMTATEAHIRYELMQRLLGPTAARFITDWLNPCVSRTFNIYFRAGLLPEMPQSVVDAQAQYTIEYTGPMARSHKREIAMAINGWVSSLVELGAVLPDVLDTPDPDKLALQMGINSGVPAEVMRSKDEIEAVRKQRQEREAAAQKAELDKLNAQANQANALAGAQQPAEGQTLQ